MKIVKKLVEVEVEVLEYTDIAAKIIGLQAGDCIIFKSKDFENNDLEGDMLKAFSSLGILEADSLSNEIILYKHPRHKSLTYTTQWNKDKTELTITRIQL